MPEKTDTSIKYYFVGEQPRRMKIVRPVCCGIITDWTLFEKILHHTVYNELRVNPDESNFFMIDKPNLQE
jgi:actin-related protein